MSLKWEEIEFTECAPSSPKEIYVPNGSKAIREFICAWDDRYKLAYKLLGYPEKEGTGLKRYTPHPYHPYNYDSTFMYAVRVTECIPWGKPVTAGTANAPVPTYTKAKLTVEYETLPYDVYSDDDDRLKTDSSWPGGRNESLRWCQITTKPAAEFLTLPQGHFKWISDQQLVAQTLGKVDCYRDLVVVWHQVPDIPPAVSGVIPGTSLLELESFIGTVNKEAMVFKRRGKNLLYAPQDTLLLLDADPVPKASAYGDAQWEITFRWRYRQQTHQRFRRYKPDGGGPGVPSYDYERISLNGSNTYSDSPLNFPFQRKDHRYLFSFAVPP